MILLIIVIWMIPLLESFDVKTTAFEIDLLTTNALISSKGKHRIRLNGLSKPKFYRHCNGFWILSTNNHPKIKNPYPPHHQNHNNQKNHSSDNNHKNHHNQKNHSLDNHKNHHNQKNHSLDYFTRPSNPLASLYRSAPGPIFCKAVLQAALFFSFK